MMKKLVLFVLLAPFLTFGSIHPKKPSLGRIKESLGQKAREVTSIAASIKSLEKEIGKVNNKYLERSRSSRSLEQKLARLKESLDARAGELEAKQEQAKKLARLYALEGHDEEDDNALLKKQILSNLLEKRIKVLSDLKGEAAELGSTVAAYQARLLENRRSEESLYALIVDLENKKKDLSKNYISSLESKNDLEAKLENALAKRKAYKAVARTKVKAAEIRLIPPLDNFINFKGGKNGVTFKYDTKAPIKASAGGRIVYAGELASYGKVVMIDHGQDVRSVLLGDLQAKVKKGDNVTQGQIIGYTLAEPGLKKSLYYEIRKKNIAQNTLQWLESAGKMANI